MALNAKQQAYLDSLADDEPPADDDDDVEELEWKGKRYRVVTDEPDDAPKPVKRKAKTAPAPASDKEPAPKAPRRFLT